MNVKTKTFVILLVAIPLLLIAGGVYYFYKNSQSSSPLPSPLGGEGAEGEEKVKLFVGEQVISPILSFSGEHIWYMTKEGKMFRKALTPSQEGAEEYLLPESIQGAQGVIWQKDGSDFIVEQNLDGHTRYKFFDADARIFTDYPSQMRSPRFLAGDQKIIYDWVRTDGGHELKKANLDGRSFEKVADLYEPLYQIVVSPVNQEVMLFANKIFLVSLFNGQFREIASVGEYEGLSFSPDGAKILVSAGSGLRVYDLATFERVDMRIMVNIEATTWSKDSQAVIVGSTGGFVKYKLGGGEEETYKFGSQEDFNPADLMLHPDKPLLFFRDEKTGYLYRVELK